MINRILILAVLCALAVVSAKNQIRHKVHGSDNKCTRYHGGECGDTRAMACVGGEFIRYACDGASWRQCCVNGTLADQNSQNANDPDADVVDSTDLEEIEQEEEENAHTGDGYLPPAPTPTGVEGTSPLGAYTGVCMRPRDCPGAVINGGCPGRSNKMCVAETKPAYPKTQWLSHSEFMAAYGAIGSERATALLPYFNEAMDTVMEGVSESKRCNRLASFIAQTAHESVGLLYFEEIASGSAYEGRSDLGNNQRGDGRRFKGRGPIQLTGRFNYGQCAEDLHLNLLEDPEQVCFPSVGFKTTVWYWMKHDLNKWADRSDSSTDPDYETLTRRINGGTNGFTDRKQRYNAIKRKCADWTFERLASSTPSAGVDGVPTETNFASGVVEQVEEVFDQVN